MKKDTVVSKLNKTQAQKIVALLKKSATHVTDKMLNENPACKKLIPSKKEAIALVDNFIENMGKIKIPQDCFKRVLDSINFENQKLVQSKGPSMDFATIIEKLINGVNKEYVDAAISFGVENPKSISMQKEETIVTPEVKKEVVEKKPEPKKKAIKGITKDQIAE